MDEEITWGRFCLLVLRESWWLFVIAVVLGVLFR